MRGFYEALDHDLYIQGHEDYIKTSCVFPYYINTTKSLQDQVSSVCKYRYTMTPEEVAHQVVEAIVYNKATVMIPKIFSVLFYM